ncbi:MAG: Protein of unknown function (DUF3445) [Verrucomicrobia bacterium]|nr:MAG: Protein of unknown function (DUF3445) [Verrucomicrobiota bacterium]
MTSLAELFPSGDYRFHLTLRRGEPGEFFQARAGSGRVLAERAKWLAETPARYAALLPEGETLLAEVAELGAKDWGLPRTSSVHGLGAVLEPDFLLLSPDATGAFRLRGGALCFPTGWALEEKLGHTLDFIHGVVPGLNPALASPIQQFLTRLKPGVAFLRDNWGLVANAELNQHPARALAPPVLPVALDRLWLRVEHQALVALPQTGGVLFGIRLALHRLDQVALDPAARAGLKQALGSMPAEVAAYKRLDAVRAAVVGML